jgi:hypothetical protein
VIQGAQGERHVGRGADARRRDDDQVRLLGNTVARELAQGGDDGGDGVGAEGRLVDAEGAQRVGVQLGGAADARDDGRWRVGEQGFDGADVGGGAGDDGEVRVERGLRDGVLLEEELAQLGRGSCDWIGISLVWRLALEGLRAIAERPSFRVHARALAQQPPVAPRKAVSWLEDDIVNKARGVDKADVVDCC